MESDDAVTHTTHPAPTRRPRPFLLAGRFLWAPSPAEAGELPAPATDEAAWSRAGTWLPLWGLLVGVCYALVFGLCWRVFGEYQGVRWLPAVAVLAVDLALWGFRPLAGAAQLAARHDAGHAPPVAATLAIVLVALIKFSLLICLPIGIWQSAPGGDSSVMSPVLARLRLLLPAPIYRPLILMPLWGRFAMELTLAVGRTAPEATGRFKRMAAGVSVPAIFGHWVLCATLTVIFCSGSGYHLARAVMMALGVFVVVYLAAFVMARRLNGQSEATAGAACLAGEITFLVLYISHSSAIYWY